MGRQITFLLIPRGESAAWEDWIGEAALVFDNTASLSGTAHLGESDASLCRFYAFIRDAKRCAALGDNRPLYICNFLERLDEAVDLRPVLEAVNATGRQVFVAVPHYYSVTQLEEMLYANL